MSQGGGKSGLRKRLRLRRNALDRAHQERAAGNLAAQIKVLPAFRQSERIALYLANDGEIDPAGVLAWSLAHGKRCYAPIIVDAGGNARKNTLLFAEITTHTSFQNNRFGIAEPAVPFDQLLSARELDLVLLPLVGFDRRGNRIGMGGGFYDTTFAFKKTSSSNFTGLPRLVGLAHEIQRVENIDAERWDIPISAVVTDRRIYRCDPSCGPGRRAMTSGR